MFPRPLEELQPLVWGLLFMRMGLGILTETRPAPQKLTSGLLFVTRLGISVSLLLGEGPDVKASAT